MRRWPLFFPDSTSLRLAAQAYAGGRDLTCPQISPQFAHLGGFPPTLIHVGKLEALLDDSLILAERMATHGTEVELSVYSGMWHVWQLFAGQFREADRPVMEIGGFVRIRLG
jgi:acetyl esterase/lipase